MPSISVCMMVQNAEKTLAIALTSLANVYDELIIVDGGSTDSTCDIALSFGARIIHSQWTGYHDQQRNVYLRELRTDWFFTIDADEFIDIKTLAFLEDFKKGKISENTDNYMIFRRWISPFSRNHYIISDAYQHEWLTRLLKYNPNLRYEGIIHENINGLEKHPQQLSNLNIYHLDLFINPEEKRYEKLKYYSKKYFGEKSYPAFIFHANYLYLPGFNDLQIKQIKNEEILPSVKKLLDNLCDNNCNCKLLNTSHSDRVNSFIYTQLKQDEIYTGIYYLLIKENINNILIIGSVLSENMTKVLKKSIQDKKSISLVSTLDVESDDIYRIVAEIKNIESQKNISSFDLVMINTTYSVNIVDLTELTKAQFILIDNINSNNGRNYLSLLHHEEYALVTHNICFSYGWAIFKEKNSRKKLEYLLRASDIEIHFFTIVLNGQPFIRYHIEVFKQLPFKWHWHIVEGVADLKNDTAWSVQLGGHITDDIHRNGRSYDGTTEYLDDLAQLYPDNITIYRKPEGVFWEGKREMVNAPLLNIQEECLLWQVDVDELWTVEQICIARQMFINNPDKTAAFYWCWYFVGENLIISTRNCYAQNPQQEWLRTWRFKPGAFWAAHEPPILVEPLPDGKLNNVAAINPFMHGETEELGLIFQHFAYVTKEQLQFKEKYYGYTNAVSQWLDLQEQTKFPILLSQYFSWVQDNTKVDIANAYGIVPIAQREFDGNWRFLQSADVQKQTLEIQKTSPIIIVDAVFFQLYKTGIARVWKSLLQEWADNGFTKHIIVIDRAGTAPQIAGIKYRTLPHYDYNNTDADRQILQQVCDEEGADLFISTYYTTPTATPSVFLAHDMIPELFGWNLNHPMWQEKHYGIQHASAYIAVSENTARDLVKCFPDISLESVIIAQNGVNHQIFSPPQPEEFNVFKTKYGITKPYFILVGAGSGYKNSILFFQAFSKLASSYGFDIVSTGIGGLADLDFRAYTSGSIVHILQLSDEELAIAYSGAIALIYPSKYEGFGLPVLEAIACGCPVITSPNASIPEVAGKAALYVQDDDVEGMANALCEVQKPSVRKSLISAGLEQAKKFSWANMAKVVSSVLIDTTLLPLNLKEINLIVFPDWSQPEESLGLELQRVISAIATHPDSKQITLLIDTSNISSQDAELLLSGMTMNLLMEEDLDVSEGLEISLISNLADIQWKALLSRLTARIILESENKQALAQVKAQNLSSYNLDSLIELALYSSRK